KLHFVGLGQSLVVIDVVFLVTGLPSIVSARLSFQARVFGDLTSMIFFIVRGWLYGLLISFCLFLSLWSLISLYLSSLITSLVALPFTIFATPGLDSVFLCVCFVHLEGCLWSQASALVSRWLASILSHPGCLSSSHASFGVGSFLVLRWHEFLVCACLVCE
ncbi:hypothetical protein HID58_086396, partial [Brassica napus]